ncbi:ATP-binding cassette domain-containing protein [Candidatus Paracaedibacter symbiosus]|uniref:ATP-binding cassette domain-containing protein n=1 Tax=Candidatus Paracaedibacter symbiosus TaxID=244582 RepID=UPI00094E473D|nr:ABC transporter ATP-binding protein [Candidatus Paracaedibacter symbiosus]
MINKTRYKHYWACLSSILLKTFEDKHILIHLFLSIIFLVIGIISTIAVPFMLKKIIESFSSSEIGSITLILLGYGAIWMISQASLHLRAIFTYRIEQRITFVLGLRVISHIYTLSHSYFLDQKPGALTNVIRRAQTDVPSIILGVFFHVLPTIIEFLFVLVLISSLYPPIYTLMLAGTLVAFFIYTLISMKSILNDRQIANEIDKNTEGVVIDWLSNYEAVKVFGRHELAINVCEKELKKRETAEVKFLTKFSTARLGQSIILGLGLSFLTYFVAVGVLQGTLTVGDFVLFNGYILQFILPISILGQIIQDIKKALLDMKGIIDILLTTSEIKETPHPLRLSGNSFDVEFKDVTFMYKDRVILDKVSFEIESGKTLLILGETGKGKSTLAKLLLRLYDSTKGQVLINQTNIKHLSFQSLYEIIGWVPQETYLLNDTIKNNILFVQPDASLKDIELALERACLLDFIDCLPDGIHTIVGDKGLKLSGGEKQRLAIARLFLKKPKICIFDEATSSLDKNTELLIQNNVETFLPDMTKIIITHRPFMINKADKIISLNNGGISQTVPPSFNSCEAQVAYQSQKTTNNYWRSK